MHIISDISQVKAITKRGTKTGAIEECVRMGFDFRVAHDGWPVIFIPEVTGLQSARKPNFEALRHA